MKLVRMLRLNLWVWLKLIRIIKCRKDIYERAGKKRTISNYCSARF